MITVSLAEIPVPGDVASVQSFSKGKELVSVWSPVSLFGDMSQLEMLRGNGFARLTSFSTGQQEISFHHLLVPLVQIESVIFPTVVPISDESNTMASEAKKGSHDSVRQ